MDEEFINRITKIVEAHYSNEGFGVSELAQEAGMSRSNLLRKIKRFTNLSVSQFIRKIRLERAMDLLRDSTRTVSEVAFETGFGSTSYFIKCFREAYGYPPGEAGKSISRDSSQTSAQKTHQLAAIMFTDIQGYTALMQQDESRAMAMRNKHREIFDSTTKKYFGRILQYFGDGTLSTFSSAIDAVKCSIEMQLAFLKDPLVPVRIGIHTGDVVVREDDIIGDGVNVASRIESLAESGSVCISAKVYDEIKNQPGIYAKSLGTFELKNVQRPVEVYALTNPGLIIPQENKEVILDQKDPSLKPIIKHAGFQWAAIVLIALMLGFVFYQTEFFGLAPGIGSDTQPSGKKSIAVLPFVNNSQDSNNVYLINGLMEAALNNLQKIKGLRVISRTSVEQYRNHTSTIPQIAETLDVQYIVEGSGQKIGNKIALNVQLLDARRDDQIWSGQYIREVHDIFDLQRDVANQIVDQIEVIITPEEEARINKIPTQNPVAYDLFLKGLHWLNLLNEQNLDKALDYFIQALEEDKQFARAYAAVAITYYHMQEFLESKQYTDEINHYADQALFFDEQLPQGLIAKGLFYMSNKEFAQAVPYFEKALEYNPNYGLAYIYLIDLYVNHIPNTKKYLEYALGGMELDVGSYDSITTSFMFLHIANAFIQTGFVDEAEQYINRSLSYDPDNIYSEYTRAYILYAKYGDLNQTRDLLGHAYAKDTTRLDVMQEVAKVYYFLGDFNQAYSYYKKFAVLREKWNLDIFSGENAKIAVTCDQLGLKTEADHFFTQYQDHLDRDRSIYQPMSLAAYQAYQGDIDEAIASLRRFAQADDFHYWTILFMKHDPLLKNLIDHPEFNSIYKSLEQKFWENHRSLRQSLKEKNLI